ncbi:spore coat protein [Clostridium swellfunianum]|uniref:spore coat protein n=1 Tax=Clostridium swellfunianum TaxID=1367462 RepID=UPI00202F6689|nr:spore coat protein [Clostridium swellfunianum]MCM0648279.1 spore coat protein [Clostridium swellfunianum]
MSWFSNILSDEDNSSSSLGDKEMASDMLMASKADITALAKAVTEAANPQLRQILTNQLNSCINDHFQLSDLAIQKGWYNAFASPGQQIKQDMQEAQNLINQDQQNQQS